MEAATCTASALLPLLHRLALIVLTTDSLVKVCAANVPYLLKDPVDGLVVAVVGQFASVAFGGSLAELVFLATLSFITFSDSNVDFADANGDLTCCRSLLYANLTRLVLALMGIFHVQGRGLRF